MLDDDPKTGSWLLDADELERVGTTADRISLSFGDSTEALVSDADGIVVVLSGSCRVLKTGGAGQGAAAVSLGVPEERELAVLRPGHVLGPVDWAPDPGAIAVRASGDVTLLRLSREQLRKLAERDGALTARLEMARQVQDTKLLLGMSPPLRSLSEATNQQLIDTLVEVSVRAGDEVFREGDAPGPLYIVRRGRLVARRTTSAGQTIAVEYLRPGSVFGVASFERPASRRVSVSAHGDATLLALAPQAARTLCEGDPAFRKALDDIVTTLEIEQEAPFPLDFSAAGRLGDARRAHFVEEMEDRQVDGGVSSEPPELAPTEEAPFASADGHFKKTKRRVGAFPFVRQVDESDCGVASLAMIFRHYGKRIAIGRIRNLAGAGPQGTSLTGLRRAASELGLAARTVRVSRRNLDRMPTPAILHWENDHWLVLVEVKAHRVRIADPAVGTSWIRREELLEKWNGFAVLFDFTDKFASAEEDGASFSWVWRYFEPYRGVLGLVTLLSLAVALLTFTLPVLTQVVIDRVVVDGARNLLTAVLATMAGVFVLVTAGRVLQGYLLAFVAVRIDASVLDYLARRLLALPMSYFTLRRTGDIQRRIEGAHEIRGTLIKGGLAGALATVQIAVALGVMSVYSRRLTLVFLAVTPLYVGIMAFAARYLKPLFARLEEEYGRYDSDQLDSIKGIETVKAASAEAHFRERLLERFLRISKQRFSADYWVLIYENSLATIAYLSQILFLWVGAVQTMRGELTLGGFVAFNTLVAMANGPILMFLSLWDELQYSQILLNRLSDVFETVPEQGHERADLIPVSSLGGEIELRGVSFAYPGPDRTMILHNVDLSVRPGETVAIVGHSGAGKTTLARLLAGLLEPTEGSVTFDGVDLRALNHRDLRRKIGIVLQDNHMFSGSILENIAFGEEPDMERAVAAARVADAHGFVSSLPLGYATRIGETGVRLSGGQIQRIAIARALYKNPSILIFDEATSAIDSESESVIQKNLSRFATGRTAVIIAHRASTARWADRIVVLEEGEIVEQGSHGALVDRGGLYFQLIRQQIEA